MQRTPEPELMDHPAQALAYARADFNEPNTAFVGHFATTFPEFARGTILDLGCGPGDIVLRLAARLPAARLIGVDGAGAMLALAREALDAKPALRPRVEFVQALLGSLPDGFGPGDAVVSNSLLHHLPDPGLLWRTAVRVACPGAAVLVMDLARPDSPADAGRIVATHAASEPAILREDFYNSLLAAFTPEEVRQQLAAAALPGIRVRMVSDRHWLASGRLP
jgi:ubiquinone/menaquinone biosynthesis C-methylase UbiE